MSALQSLKNIQLILFYILSSIKNVQHNTDFHFHVAIVVCILSEFNLIFKASRPTFKNMRDKSISKAYLQYLCNQLFIRLFMHWKSSVINGNCMFHQTRYKSFPILRPQAPCSFQRSKRSKLVCYFSVMKICLSKFTKFDSTQTGAPKEIFKRFTWHGNGEVNWSQVSCS